MKFQNPQVDRLKQLISEQSGEEYNEFAEPGSYEQQRYNRAMAYARQKSNEGPLGADSSAAVPVAVGAGLAAGTLGHYLHKNNIAPAARRSAQALKPRVAAGILDPKVMPTMGRTRLRGAEIMGSPIGKLLMAGVPAVGTAMALMNKKKKNEQLSEGLGDPSSMGMYQQYLAQDRANFR